MAKKTENTTTQTTELPKDPNITTVALDEPIEIRGNRFTSIDIRKPTTGALRKLSLARVIELDVDSLFTLIPRVSSPALTEKELSVLSPADFVSLSTAVVSFFASTSAKEKAGLE